MTVAACPGLVQLYMVGSSNVSAGLCVSDWFQVVLGLWKAGDDKSLTREVTLVTRKDLGILVFLP